MSWTLTSQPCDFEVDVTTFTCISLSFFGATTYTYIYNLYSELWYHWKTSPPTRLYPKLRRNNMHLYQCKFWPLTSPSWTSTLWTLTSPPILVNPDIWRQNLLLNILNSVFTTYTCMFWTLMSPISVRLYKYEYILKSVVVIYTCISWALTSHTFTSWSLSSPSSLVYPEFWCHIHHFHLHILNSDVTTFLYWTLTSKPARVCLSWTLTSPPASPSIRYILSSARDHLHLSNLKSDSTT